jgi:hypothetical protein
MSMKSVAIPMLVLTMSMSGLLTCADAVAQPRDHAAPQWRAKYPPVGGHVNRVPDGSEAIRVGRDPYHYHSGVFYRPGAPGVYVVVRAPLGARVQHLPFGYVTFFVGTRQYFYANFTYYLWDTRARDYVVVAAPDGADKAVAAAAESGSSELFVYPASGQTEEQRDRDRYECYVWAAGQTGFDPSAENADVGKAADYRRALSACLEGRGYTVK